VLELLEGSGPRDSARLGRTLGIDDVDVDWNAGLGENISKIVGKMLVDELGNDAKNVPEGFGLDGLGEPLLLAFAVGEKFDKSCVGFGMSRRDICGD
jgi:hypothetical protein